MFIVGGFVIEFTLDKISSSSGSVIVKFTVVINGTQQQDAQDFVNNLQKTIASGKMGNFTIDAKHPPNTIITVKGMYAGEPVPGRK